MKRFIHRVKQQQQLARPSCSHVARTKLFFVSKMFPQGQMQMRQTAMNAGPERRVCPFLLTRLFIYFLPAGTESTTTHICLGLDT